MTTNPNDPWLVSYARAVEELEEFEARHPPHSTFNLILSAMAATMSYARRQEGQLVGCRGICLKHFTESEINSATLVPVPACPYESTCFGAKLLRERLAWLDEWTRRREKVMVERRQAGLAREAKGGKRT